MWIALLGIYFVFSALGCLDSITGALIFGVGWMTTIMASTWYGQWNRYHTVPTLKLSPSAKRWTFWALCALGLGLFVWRFVAGIMEVGSPLLYQGATAATPLVYIASKMLHHNWHLRPSQAANAGSTA